MSTKERKRKFAKEHKRAQKGAKEGKGALPPPKCEQPGLKQPGLGTPKKEVCLVPQEELGFVTQESPAILVAILDGQKRAMLPMRLSNAANRHLELPAKFGTYLHETPRKTKTNKNEVSCHFAAIVGSSACKKSLSTVQTVALHS